MNVIGAGADHIPLTTIGGNHTPLTIIDADPTLLTIPVEGRAQGLAPHTTGHQSAGVIGLILPTIPGTTHPNTITTEEAAIAPFLKAFHQGRTGIRGGASHTVSHPCVPEGVMHGISPQGDQGEATLAVFPHGQGGARGGAIPVAFLLDEGEAQGGASLVALLISMETLGIAIVLEAIKAVVVLVCLLDPFQDLLLLGQFHLRGKGF
ncbi:unnamed protein product [Ilex paraguariensis]|uniref:Uncharacterized protein n=1 Tax=Ilex paraguariensis TaxID=185542 RepID=A0ABC8T8D2_9AQUA